MSEHSRFDEDHRKICEDCTADYFDFCQEQAEEARLDSMSDVIQPDEFDPSGVYGNDNDWD